MNEHKYTYLKISHEHSPNVLRAGVQGRVVMVVVLGFGWRTLMKNKFGPRLNSRHHHSDHFALHWNRNKEQKQN